ncbi:hypothetical protein B5V02_06615 [Mesorhizobium kowhaii]|uniref:Uncharacterized protein n=1 Tax=Mesorhizobium kowhaii TaxID=1300272 RepID=A0A2W7C905_9HYPH|nr:hypothetical protein B5V02_06615 [Mesorhizobium kowhaii]
MKDSARLTDLSCSSVDLEPCLSGLAKRGFDGAGAMAGRLGLPFETAGWRLHRGHHAGGRR